MKKSLKILTLCSLMVLSACGNPTSSENPSSTTSDSLPVSETTSETTSTPISETTSEPTSQIISEDSSPTTSEVSEDSSEPTSEIDTKNYVSSDWTPIGGDKGYYYEGETIVNNVFDSEIKVGNVFQHDDPVLNINNTPVGANYSVSVDAVGTYAGDVDAVMFAGIVAWYQDADNYVVIGAQWADFDRPHEIREVFVTGKVAGSLVSWADYWTDNCGVYPADGIKLTVTKVGKNFAFNLRGDNHAVKEGNMNINGTDSATASVGIVAANDAFVLTNFATEEVVPATQVTYNLTSGTDVYELVLDTADQSAILKHTADGVVQENKVGSFVADGRNVTLTFGAETLYVKVFDATKTFEFFTPVEPEEGAVILDGSAERASSVLLEDQTDDVIIDTDFVGTITEPGHAIKVGFNPWFVDADNFVDVYIEWSNSDRSFEIRAMQITGKIAGESLGWFDIWCDGSNKLVSDGFHFTLTKSGQSFSVALSSGEWSKTGTRVITNLDTNLSYDVIAYVEGDEVSFSNLNVYQDLAANYDLTGAPTMHNNKMVLADGEKAISKTARTDSDFVFTTDFIGTLTEAGHAVKVGFYPWFVDEDNFIEVYVEWSNSERSHEIRAMQITGEIAGTHVGWFDIWCDGSNKLVSDGFTFTLTKTGQEFAVAISSGEWTKADARTIASLDTGLAYKTGYYVFGDTITMTDFTNPL